MAAEGDIIIQFTFSGEDGEVVPDDATYVTVDKSVTVIPERAFHRHPNIVELKCHDGVEKVEERALLCCPSLRRVKMPSVKAIGFMAFSSCNALTDVECDKLERIGERAFEDCNLRSINLPSVKIVEEYAFNGCNALTDVKFDDKLERIQGGAFEDCTSLERITLPLKDGMITTHDDYGREDVFRGCKNLKHVDLVGGVHETVDALPLDEWKNEMKEEIDSINWILPITPTGGYYLFYGYHDYDVNCGKGRAIQAWIRSVLHKIVDYKQQHRDLLTAATSILIEELALPQDIVINKVLPFLELPSCNWKDDKWHGWGKMMYDDGRVYFGNWKDDKKHGWGEMTYADGNVFEGNWVDDKRHGGGLMTFAWGDVYEGNFMDDKMHGYGKMTCADGEMYGGKWKNGFELEEDDDDEDEEE